MLKNPPLFLLPHLLEHPATEQCGAAGCCGFAGGTLAGMPDGVCRSGDVAGLSAGCRIGMGVVALGGPISDVDTLGGTGLAGCAAGTLWASASVGTLLDAAVPERVPCDAASGAVGAYAAGLDGDGSIHLDRASVPRNISAISAFSLMTAINIGS